MADRKKNRKDKPWAGRFKEATHKLVDEFNASITFDKRLYKHDILGSKAHAATLKEAGILTAAEYKKIIKGLEEVEKEIAAGKVNLTIGMEDIHMAVEKRLTEKIGPLGGKLHTGRSRNDQVALDIRLYLRDEIYEILDLVHEFRKALVEVAEANIDVIMPGYTHLQRAQPVLFSHHLLAYYEMLVRDTGRLFDCAVRFDEMPLGSGALAGSPYDLNRNLTAELLGFSRVTENSMDSVSDRDFIIEFLAAASILMMHISRLSEEIVVWSSQEFAFIELSDAFSTGSSIMPQKKNPDVAELARGKTGRVYGHLVSMLTTMKALPLAYNKDMQEDKEPLFDTIDTLKIILQVYPPMLRTMKVKKEAMLKATRGGFLNATDVADYLVKKGLPFRDAHHVSGTAVAYCIENGKTLEDLSMDEWRKFSRLFGEDIKSAVAIENSLNTRKIYAGTALKTVKARLKAVKKEMEEGTCCAEC